MRVRVLKKTTAYWNHEIKQFEPDDELVDDLARHLADNAPPETVEVLEADPEPEPEPEQPPPPEDPDPGGGDEPPVDGKIEDLMAWVGGDPDRAEQALAAEQAKDKPRTTALKLLAAVAE